MKKVLKAIASILSNAVIVIEVIVILFLLVTRLSGGMPQVFGYTLSVIATPSMQPEIKVGDIVISKIISDDYNLKVGDIVTYKAQTGEMQGYNITHRVVEINKETDKIITKGDANPIKDEEISRSDIISVVLYKTVVFAFLYKIINTAWGFVLIVVLPIVLMIGLEIYFFIKTAKNEIQGDTRE